MCIYIYMYIYIYILLHVTSSGLPIWPRWREVAVLILLTVPEVAVRVFSTPDDGCGDTRYM